MKDLIECGVLCNAGQCDPITCDPLTGDVVYESDLMGRTLFSDLTVEDPLLMQHDTLCKMLAQCSDRAEGIIITETYMIFLKDGVASYCALSNTDTVLNTVEYGLDIVYEE